MTTETQAGPQWTLVGSRRSPYVRKVRVAAEELGLARSLALREVFVTARRAEAVEGNPHPLGQIPALIAEQGEVIFDSLVICEWLCLRAEGALFDRGEGRVTVLVRHALAQTLTDMLVRLFSEQNRAGDGPISQYGTAFETRLRQGWDTMERNAGDWMSGPFDMGQIAAAVMLAYADFRHDRLGWREGRAQLAQWHADVSRRKSMQQTVFQS